VGVGVVVAGVGYLLGLRKRKLNIYLGFARREASFVLQGAWKRRQERKAFKRQVRKPRRRGTPGGELWSLGGVPTALVAGSNRWELGMGIQRDKVATERLGVLFDLWDQGGTPLADRRKQFQRIQDMGLGSLRSLVAIRATLLQAARQLPVRPLPCNGRLPLLCEGT
jgi:hypothetical protein